MIEQSVPAAPRRERDRVRVLRAHHAEQMARLADMPLEGVVMAHSMACAHAAVERTPEVEEIYREHASAILKLITKRWK